MWILQRGQNLHLVTRALSVLIIHSVDIDLLDNKLLAIVASRHQMSSSKTTAAKFLVHNKSVHFSGLSKVFFCFEISLSVCE